MLTLLNSWYEEDHKFVRWSPASQARLREAKISLGDQLKPFLSLRCKHIKGRGGAEGLRCVGLSYVFG